MWLLQAEEDGVACVENLAGKKGHVNYATVPGIVYTHPEVASVGITEEQAKEQNLDYKVLTCGAENIPGFSSTFFAVM